MSRRRSPVAVAVLSSLVLTLAACASVPTSGPVHQGPPITVDDQDLIYRAIPQPPQAGMTPDELVRGFLAASSSSSDAYHAAREFLTAKANAGWNPLAGVQVYDNTGIQTKVSATSVAVSGVMDGTIGPDGAYQVATGGQPLRVAYGITKVEGEWRISALPDGLVLGRGDIDREYRTYDLYFFDPTFSVLVPDPVTIPVMGSGLPSTLVRALLSGPTTWLAPAVRTAFPEGTELSLGSIPVDAGVAQVDLSNQVLAADDSTREALSAQLVWTLRRLPGIAGVSITVGGQPFTVPGAPPVQSIDMWSSYDPDPPASVALTAFAAGPRGLLKVNVDDALVPAPGLLGSGKPLVASPALSPDGMQIAAVTAASRTQLWEQATSGAGPPRRVLTGAVSLSRPSWDRSGAIWVVDRGGRGLLEIVGGAATAVPILGLPPGLSTGAVVGVSVAPDGTRVALLLRRGGQVTPWVARVERDGTTVRLSSPRRVEGVVVDAYDVDWVSVEQLAVLGVDGAGSRKLFVVTPGQYAVSTQPTPAAATEVAAAPGAPTLIGADGVLYQQGAASWTKLGAGSGPCYPG